MLDNVLTSRGKSHLIIISMQRPLQIHVELCDQFTRIACNNFVLKRERENASISYNLTKINIFCKKIFTRCISFLVNLFLTVIY